MRYLRSENAYLKGQDTLRELNTLPNLSLLPSSRESTPPLIGDETDPESDLDDDSHPITLRSLATESKLLYRDVISFSSSPRVVDLSLSQRSTGAAWAPKRLSPMYQVQARKREAERLNRRVAGLLDRAKNL